MPQNKKPFTGLVLTECSFVNNRASMLIADGANVWVDRSEFIGNGSDITIDRAGDVRITSNHFADAPLKTSPAPKDRPTQRIPWKPGDKLPGLGG